MIQKARSAQQLGTIIQQARLARGLSQVSLADLVGKGQKTISKIENGSLSTRLDTIFAVLAALNLEAALDSRTERGGIGDIF